MRTLAACWGAIRLWAAHGRLLGERQAWRELLLSLQAEHVRRCLRP